MRSVNPLSDSASQAPPRPASAPDASTADQRMPITSTPRESAAAGGSPAARRRRPYAVRPNTRCAAPAATAVAPTKTSAHTDPPSPGTVGDDDAEWKISLSRYLVTPSARRFTATPATI